MAQEQHERDGTYMRGVDGAVYFIPDSVLESYRIPDSIIQEVTKEPEPASSACQTGFR